MSGGSRQTRAHDAGMLLLVREPAELGEREITTPQVDT
jgi:hypothetical protein